MSVNAIPAQGTLLQIATGTGGAQTVTAIALGFPTILTIAANGRQNGDVVNLAAFTGADAALLNGKTVVVKNKTTNTYAIDVDTTGKTIVVTGATATPVTYTTINEMKTYNGLDGQATEIDTTDLNSAAKEFIQGLVDEGGFSCTIHRLPSDPGQQALLAARTAGTLKGFKLVLPVGSPSVASFSAYVKQLPISGGVDAVQTSNVALRITGAVTWA